MSVEAATLKRLAFLTSRWDYDLPHKFVWVVDINGVKKAAIDKILTLNERVRTNLDWQVHPEVSLDALRSFSGYNMLAQNIGFPNESFVIGTVGPNNSGGAIHGAYADTRNPYGSQNKLDITFLETNNDFIDYFLKPWIIAANHKGLIEDGDDSTNIKSTIDVYLYSRAEDRDFVPTLRKHITFHQCVPFFVDADKVSYGQLQFESDLTKVASFNFQRYTVNDTGPERFFATMVLPNNSITKEIEIISEK